MLTLPGQCCPMRILGDFQAISHQYSDKTRASPLSAYGAICIMMRVNESIYYILKGTGFPLEERQILGIHGLLPPTLGNQELQAQRVMRQLSSKDSDLHKYLDLMALLQRNERLFYRLLMDNLVNLMPIVYTPTVGKACQKYGEIFTSPK